MKESEVFPINFFDPETTVANLSGNLPHWRQTGATYFVTFRLADALPRERLNQWQDELQRWIRDHPEPHDEATRRSFYELFPLRLQQWLDAGHGSCILSMHAPRKIVQDALQYFHNDRYTLRESVVASNHVHALVTPSGSHTLSSILHSWKSFTAHKILKVEAASRRLSTNGAPLVVWQKESFDHIVRSPDSLEDSTLYSFSSNLRRDAAATIEIGPMRLMGPI